MEREEVTWKKSIKFDIVEDESGVSVQFFMADYGTFQDKGVKGTGGEIKSGDHKGKWKWKKVLHNLGR